MMASEHPKDAASPAEAEPKKDVLITPDGEELDQSIIGTAKIDTSKHSSVSTNANRLKSLKYGTAGLIYVLVREQSIQLASVVTVAVIIVGLWLQIPVFYWAFLTLALGLVWVTECINTALEAAINLGTEDPNAMAKIGKDVASAASLVSTIVFVIICILILVPRIIDRVNDLAG